MDLVGDKKAKKSKRDMSLFILVSEEKKMGGKATYRQEASDLHPEMR